MGNSIIDSKILVIFSNDFYKRTVNILKHNKILKNVYEAVFLTGSFKNSIKGYYTDFAFIIDFLPIIKVFPARTNGPNFTLRAIWKNDKGIIPEEVRNGFFIIL